MAPFESFVKACQAFFSDGTHGRKVEISEFKELTDDDKSELSTMLNTVSGYEHPQWAPKS